MKTVIFSLLILGLSIPIYGQVNKIKLRLEYSPNYSKLVDEVVNERFKLGHNIFIKTEYSVSERTKVTGGIGLLNTGEKEESVIGGQSGIDKIKFIHNYSYALFPFGAKQNIGKFYLNPEIAVGINISNKFKQITYYSDGQKEVEKKDEQLNIGEFNKITFPILLTFGYEFNKRNINILLGLRGYYSITNVVTDVPRNSHYIGLGILTGIIF